MIQFFTVTLLYLEGSNLSNNQFLYIDIAVLVPLCVLQSRTGAYHKLSATLPQESLLSVPIISSVLGTAAIQLFFQYYGYSQLKKDIGDDYVKCVQAEDLGGTDPPCSPNTFLFDLTSMQYVMCCLCFSISKPFRKPIWTNPLFLISVICLIVFQAYFILSVDEWTATLFGLVDLPAKYKVKLTVMIVINSVLSYIYEKWFIAWLSVCWRNRSEGKKSKTRGESLLPDTSNSEIEIR